MCRGGRAEEPVRSHPSGRFARRSGLFLDSASGATAQGEGPMHWLERTAREISETAGKPTVKTAVSSVLAVPHASVSQRSEDMAADLAPPEGPGQAPFRRFAHRPPLRHPCAFPGDPRLVPRTGTARGSRWRPGPRTRSLRRWLGATGTRHPSLIAPGQGH